MQLSLKMEPSTHGAGEAMEDWGMVMIDLQSSNLYTLGVVQLYIICMYNVHVTGVQYMCAYVI